MSYPYTLKPRESQVVAMRDIYSTKRRLIWGKPGVGKTKVALDFIGSLLHHNKIKRALVIVPSSALGVWEEQIEINCPWIPYQFYTADEGEVNWDFDGVIITNYEFFSPRRKKRINKNGKTVSYINKDRVNAALLWRPEVVCIDEGHRVKNPYTRSAKGIHVLGRSCEYAIDLTGTPTGNKRRIDLWSQFEFLKPGLLADNFKTHKHQYGVYGGFGGFKFLKEKNTEEFDKTVKPFITVMNKKGIEQKTFIPYRINMPDKAKEIYKKMEEDFIVSVLDRKVVAPIALAKLTKCQQISGGFIRTNEGEDIPLHTAKLDATADIIENLRESGIDRLLVFARFLWEIDALVKMLSNDWTTYRITGKESPTERKLAESMFNSDGGIAVCQSATGSESLSFKNCDYEIFYSVDHSHIHFTQATYRIDRNEVTKPCFYYTLQCKGTIDAGIYRMLRDHRQIADEIRRIAEERENECR